MNHCDSCKYFQEYGSIDVPCPPDIDGDNCHESTPHCTYDPTWQKVRRPEQHYCAHWQEKEE